MSFDHLQSKIKTKKCPLCATVAPPAGMEPEGAEAFCRNVLEAVSPIVPAVRFPLPPYLALGQKGLALLEALLPLARQEKLFILIQADFADTDTAKALLSQPFDADCLIVSGYPGGPQLPPLLELCRQEDKCFFLLARVAEGGELQDLVAGDRLVYQVVGDLAHRLGGNDLGQLGYGRSGILLEHVYPSDLRNLRKRWDRDFLLVSGPAEDIRFAFDQYGRGAMALLPFPASPEEARATAEGLRKELKDFVTIL